ncbi:ABC transporter ATP-binding protein [Streptomyces sp. AC563]|uniref:ABC transporter ATP-binding protein n=1 Tax=Streptomyces buecherae TaxID=2763006 RepID=UPI00164E0460|nr:ABC transporter ATP-binding protein [Streptomyces buecherae]MBC3991908.1 ABC transporter ATP-binding protein [Streptomyces buecherae]
MAEQPGLSETPDQTAVLRRAWPYLRSERRGIVLALVSSAAATACTVAVPAVIGAGVDQLIEDDRDGLLTAAGVLVGLVVVRLVLFRQSEIWLTSVGERVVRGLRELAVRRLAQAPLRFLEAHRSGDLLRRTTTEIADLANFVRSQLPEVLTVLGYLLFTTVLLLSYSPLLTLALLVVFVPGIVWVLRRFKRAAGPAFAAEAAAAGTVAATYRELVTAREMLQTNNGVDGWRQRFLADSEHRYQAARRTQKSLFIISLSRVVQGLTTVVLLLLGGWLAADGQISVGTVVVFILATRQLFDSATQASNLVGQLQLTKVGLARLLDLLTMTAPHATEPAPDAAPSDAAHPRDPSDAPSKQAPAHEAASPDRPRRTVRGTAPTPSTMPERGDLEVRDVRYSYVADAEVLHGLSLSVPAGDRVALVGPTGAGKTTLAKLVTGLYTPDAGSVSYAGVDLRALPPGELRRRIVLVPQRVHLVSGTLQDNLALVPRRPTDDEVRQAVARLDLEDWVAGLPDGLATRLGGGEGRLSAGEVQLIGLVRAALVDPAVLVLDEATADIDPRTAHKLETAIDVLRTDRTLIVIAHRETTIERLPRVVRLEHGGLDPLPAPRVARS